MRGLAGDLPREAHPARSVTPSSSTLRAVYSSSPTSTSYSTFTSEAGLGNGELGFAFTFQIFQRKPGGTFPWKTRTAWRFFAFSIKRNGAFRIFAFAYGTEGQQRPCRGVTFPTFTFELRGRKCGVSFQIRCSCCGVIFQS